MTEVPERQAKYDVHIGQIMDKMWSHHYTHPTHGPDCICMDDFVRQIRLATRFDQEFIDQYMTDPINEEVIRQFENRVQVVFRRAMDHAGRPFYRRTNQCLCCSCSDVSNLHITDPYCRNHGFAGSRPCEEHNSPGMPDEEGNMPESVQKRRSLNGAHS